jgi:hypothetical protein
LERWLPLVDSQDRSILKISTTYLIEVSDQHMSFVGMNDKGIRCEAQVWVEKNTGLEHVVREVMWDGWVSQSQKDGSRSGHFSLSETDYTFK